jgi:ABC-2 type transport system permease protein
MPNAFTNTWLIARREYLERVRTKAFLLTTVLIPVLMAAGFGIAAYLATHTHSNAHLAVLTGATPAEITFGRDLKHELESEPDSEIRVETALNTPETRAGLDHKLKTGAEHFSGYLQVILSANPTARPTFLYKPRSASDISTEQTLRSGLKTVLTSERLTALGMDAAAIKALAEPVEVTTVGGNTELAFFAAYGLFFLMYMVIMLYAMNTARSIIEEKSSRIFEVLLSTIRPDEMLAGKILGVGSVGLTQVGIWMVAAGTIATVLAHVMPSAVGSDPIFTIPQLLFFLAFFVYGFMLYSSIAAALGSMTNSEQELQQLNMFLVMPLAFCMLCLVSIIKNPDSVLSRVVSLIPLCSPLLMNFRVSIGNPQPWEIALSFVLMTATIYGILWVSSRIYRTGILMYGKKPNLPEILRWLKYS